MLLPDDVRRLLARRFQSKHREWLKASVCGHGVASAWPIEIFLGIPTEQDALKQPEGVKAWACAWKSWQGNGTLVWRERRWRSLGTQNLPEKLVLDSPDEVALSVGEATRWSRASDRFKALVQRWPALIDALPRHFNALADYGDADFRCLVEMLSWICSNPNSHLYLRQIPIAGADSKWLESRKNLVSELVAAIRGDLSGDRDFFRCCGLRPQPQLIRVRLLDAALRSRCGGLGDISAPREEVADIDIRPSVVFVVENLQTGLAFEDLPGTAVIMGLGYGVDALERISWLRQAKCVYWGDIDTHGFAILSRARTCLPSLEAILMDEETLLRHRALWVEEKEQHPASELPQLTSPEQDIYRSLKSNEWGQNVRLEQERIRWDFAWEKVRQTIAYKCACNSP